MKFLLHFLIALLFALPVTAAFAQQPCLEIPGCDPTTGLSPDVLAVYPTPNVTPLQINDSLIYDRIYRKLPGETPIYDAPGGSLVQTMGQGFSYITVKGVQGDWTQIDAKQWVPTSTLSDNVSVSRYAGVVLPEDTLPYPMAWTMRHLNPAALPGGDDSPDNPFMYRYTVVNLYDSITVDGKLWYQVASGEWIHQFNVAKMTPIPRPEGVDTFKWVSVDLYEQTLIAYEGDKPVFATLISSGLKDWGTNEGLFHIYLRYERTTMSGAYQNPDFYFLQEVPWTMYFDHDIALHGTYWHDGFGYRHSHGCVNMSISDAKWIYDWSASETDYTVSNDLGMAVYVYSSGTYDS